MGGIRTRMRKTYNSVLADPSSSSTTSSNHANTTTITQIRDVGQNSVQLSSINRGLTISMRGLTIWRKALELLNKVGSSVADSGPSNDFKAAGANARGGKISKLAFEVAEAVLRGSILVQALSDENVLFLKTTVVSSEGAKALISEDETELLLIAASDKREELESFIQDVARFGDHCNNARWHSLDLYFKKLSREHPPRRKLLNADSEIQHLMNLVYHTSELFAESTTLDKIKKEYNERLEAKNISTTTQKGDLAHLMAEIKSQTKLVKSLQKKSFWSKSFDEVVEKLVSIVHFLLLKMKEAFGDSNDSTNSFVSANEKLGPAGIALRYATIITQIETIGSLSSSAPSSMIDTFYESLPQSIRLVLPQRLRTSQADHESNQIKAEMDKTLQWLGPIARNTTKALQGFGGSGRWENFCSKVNQEINSHSDVLRIETLHHADKGRTEACILQLVVWLHRYLSIEARSGGNPRMNHRHRSLSLSRVQDQEYLVNVGENISWLSQYFSSPKNRLGKFHRLAKSVREYSTTSSSRTNMNLLGRRPSFDARINLDIKWLML